MPLSTISTVGPMAARDSTLASSVSTSDEKGGCAYLEQSGSTPITRICARREVL